MRSLRSTRGALGNVTQCYTPGVSERRGGVSRFLHGGVKNADLQTNAAGATVSRRRYDAFGDGVQTFSGIWTGPFGYAGAFGYWTEAANRPTQVGHRWYDPTTGRFLSRDPAKSGRNWYVHCDNNPFQNVDPTGLEWPDPAQVHVSPNFEGEVYVIGEPHKGYDIDGDGREDQVCMKVPRGKSSPPGMDVDLVVIVYPDGTVERRFLMGVGYICPGPVDYYVGKDGSVSGPLVVPFVPVKDWLADIRKAKRNPIPKGCVPVPQPCWTPGYGPWAQEKPRLRARVLRRR